MSKNQYESQEDKWNEEVEKRIKFGISTDKFIPRWGNPIRYCDIKDAPDFEYIGHFFDPITRTKKNDKNLIIESFLKYKEYTFKQLDEAGGALPLSKVCGFAKVLFMKDVVFLETKIKIIYRTKNAVMYGEFPNKIRDIFREDRRCKGVACLFQNEIERKTIIEKNNNF